MLSLSVNAERERVNTELERALSVGSNARPPPFYARILDAAQVESQVYSCLKSMFDEDEERGLLTSEPVVSKTQPHDDNEDDDNERTGGEGGGEGEGKGRGEGKKEQKEGEGAPEGGDTNGSIGSEGGAVGPNKLKEVPVRVRRLAASVDYVAKNSFFGR